MISCKKTWINKLVIVMILLITISACSNSAKVVPNESVSSFEVPISTITPTVGEEIEATSPIKTPEISLLPPLPEKFELSFIPLHMDELLRAGPPPEWSLIKSFPFGSMKKENILLTIYEESSKYELLPKQINGILSVKGEQYLIRDLSPSLIQNDQINCSQLCVLQRLFSDQSQFELIGCIEMFANGPGRKIFVVNDLKNDMLKTFDSWGEPSFFDLDEDGVDEFIIEFQGLHLTWPDLAIIRSGQGGLEISHSVVNSVRRNQGDYAVLTRDQKPPVISISNIQSEVEPMYNYYYNQGILQKR